MRLPDLRKKKWNFTALSFVFPFVGMLLVMLISGYKPFGKYSMLYSDMYHQYYPFFVAFRRSLRQGQSLLYNWSIGMGLDYLGLISYYLGSPLNLLSVLVPEGWLLSYFSLMMPVKLGLAGLFFCLFLEKLYGRKDFSLVCFSACYALCAWALADLAASLKKQDKKAVKAPISQLLQPVPRTFFWPNQNTNSTPAPESTR